MAKSLRVASKAAVELSKLNTILFLPGDAFLRHMYSSEDGIRSSVVPLRQTNVLVHVWLCLDLFDLFEVA